MSGHSKWHNIQKTKGAADAKRAQTFTKIAREMIVAVKEGGGGNPDSNSKLAAVIAKAKAANMPNDNIKRTIEKALGAGNTDNYERITYEGYGPNGVAVIVDAMTDNRNRTASEVRHYFDKYGGNLGATGCVSWSFDRKGVIVIDNEDQELDEDGIVNQHRHVEIFMGMGIVAINVAGGNKFHSVIQVLVMGGMNILKFRIFHNKGGVIWEIVVIGHILLELCHFAPTGGVP